MIDGHTITLPPHLSCEDIETFKRGVLDFLSGASDDGNPHVKASKAQNMPEATLTIVATNWQQLTTPALQVMVAAAKAFEDSSQKSTLRHALEYQDIPQAIRTQIDTCGLSAYFPQGCEKASGGQLEEGRV